MNMIQYLIESGVSICFFTTLYLLLLRKETFFKLNRFFLLITLLFSLLLPLMHFEVYEPIPFVLLDEVVVMPNSYMLETVSVYGNHASQAAALTISTSSLLIIIYLLGIIFFSIRTIMRIAQVVFLVHKNEVRREKDIKLVIMEQDMGPFSFLSWIFVSRNMSQMKGWKKMLQHEIEHVKQGHSLDIIILEVVSIFQWFNPFFWLLKRMIQENHEYMADQAVLCNETDPVFYKEILLTHSIGPEIRIANYFNYSLIKKRIKMMTKIRSTRLANFKMLTAVFVAVGLIILFACEQKGEVLPLESAENMPEFPDGGAAACIAWIQKEVKYPVVAQEMGISGAVIVGFVVERDGSITNVKVNRGVDPILDKEAVRVVSAMPKWISGKQDGKPARVYHSVPVMFRLDTAESNQQITASATTAKSDQQNADKPLEFAENMPEFPGGNAACIAWLTKEAKYPVVATEKGIEGTVMVGFVVERDGSVTNVKVNRGADPILDKEAVRAVSAMPKWIPGKQNGELVRVYHSVPVIFRLQKKAENK